MPVITQTLAPSVTGDGDDMFCFASCVLPPPSSFFQNTLARLPVDAPEIQVVAVGDVEEELVAPDDRRRAAPLGMRQLPGDVFGGRPADRQILLAADAVQRGPRHCGQLSADANLIAMRAMEKVSSITLRTLLLPAWNGFHISSSCKTRSRLDQTMKSRAAFTPDYELFRRSSALLEFGFGLCIRFRQSRTWNTYLPDCTRNTAAPSSIEELHTREALAGLPSSTTLDCDFSRHIYRRRRISRNRHIVSSVDRPRRSSQTRC